LLNTPSIRTAVIPAAGLGTRLLPLTRCVPKELLPLAGQPLIEHALREALQSGIRRIVCITSAAKPALEEYLECAAAGQGDTAEIIVVRQPEPCGVGDAVARAREAVGGEAFAVLLPDTLFDADPPALAQLLAAQPRDPACLVATQTVAPERVPHCGILGLAPIIGGGRLARVTSLVEKPALERAPSRHAILGRYLLTPEIFDCLAETPPDARGEVQLTDALRILLARKNGHDGGQTGAPAPLLAVRIEGECYDAGEKLGYLVANAALGLLDADTGDELRTALGAIILRRRPVRRVRAMS
jgi:UTP--glucose-1-phosphate uridylyltransferase